MKFLKSLLSLSLVLFMYQFASAQTAPSVTLSGPSAVETGIAGAFTATFSPGSQTGITIVNYVFSAPWIGAGVSGPSGLVGSMNGSTSSSLLTLTTSSTSSTANIIWGDFFNSLGSDVVTVTVNYKVGSNNLSVTATKSVTIYRVCPPIIEGPTSVQSCCTAPLTYSIRPGSACDANVFNWTITSGATITAGNGTSTITVTPSNNSGFTLTCVARRSSGLTVYSRTSSPFVVTRFSPSTPAFNVPSYMCVGSTYEISVPPLCGMSSVNWTVTGGLQIISGQGSNLIKVKPANGTIGGTMATITAQGVMTGGCIASSAQNSIKIFQTNTPPTPQGSYYLELTGGTVCNDPVYSVVWVPSSPFLNGYTSVSPEVILGGRNSTKPIKISVCNVNLCSGVSSCVYFYVSPPQPCLGRDDNNEEQAIEPSSEIITERSSVEPTQEAFDIFPNPSSGGLFISTSEETDGHAELYNSAGRLISTTALDQTERVYSLTESDLPKGIYFVKIRSSNNSFTKKVIVQ